MNSSPKKQLHLLTLSRDFKSNRSQNLFIKPINEYKSDITSLMTNYIYKSPRNDSLSNFERTLTKTKQTFYNTKKEEVSKILNQSKYHRKYRSMGMLETEESKIQVYLKSTEFKDPVESLELVLRNKLIHDKLLSNYQDREVNVFEKSMSQACVLENQKKLSKKVKIVSVMPKILEQSIFQINTPSQDSNLNTNTTSEINQQKKKIITIPNINFINGSIILLAKTLYCSKCFPESREQFSFSDDPNTNNIYLYGGFSSNIKSNVLWQLDASSFSWKQINSINIQPELRSGHTGVIHKGKYIIFGGRFVHIPLMGDLDIFDFETKTWNAPPLLTANYLKLRRHHISCVIGQHMLVHGGISETGEYLNDCYLLSLNPYKWVSASIAPYCENPTLAMHSCALVVQSDIKNSSKFNIYKYPEQTMTKRSFSRIKERGLYVFGGKSKDDQPPTNKIRVLRVGRKPLEWVTLDTTGLAPSPRYFSSLNFFEEGNYLIVHGGRNDMRKSSNCFNDTYLLELYRLEWIRVVFEEDVKVMSRFNHGAVVSGRNLIIFGGMNGKEYLGSGLFVINLDPEMAAQLNKNEFDVLGLGMGMKLTNALGKVLKLKKGNKSERSHRSNTISHKESEGNKKKKIFRTVLPHLNGKK